MIHILLLLLKIIGITLLSVLGLFVLIVLAVLFVPVRYSLDFKAEECAGNDGPPQDRAAEDGQAGTVIRLRARVSWLLHLLHATAAYDGGFGVVIRLFGVPVKRMPAPEDASSVPKQKKRKKKRPKKGHLVPGQEIGDDDDRESGAEPAADGVLTAGSVPANANGSDMAAHGSAGAAKYGGAGESEADGVLTADGGMEAARMSVGGNRTDGGAAGSVPANADRGGAGEADANSMLSEDGGWETEQPGTEHEDAPEDGKSAKLSFFQKIARFFRRLLGFFRAARVFFSKILYTIRNICGKIEHVKEVIGYYCGVLKSEEGQKSIALVKRELGRLLRHIAPTRLTGSLTLGMEDPAATGQIVAILSMFYPIYGNNVSITPDFDEKCIRGSLYLKGRIRVFTLIRIAWRVYFNKDVKKFLHMLKREEKEA